MNDGELLLDSILEQYGQLSMYSDKVSCHLHLVSDTENNNPLSSRHYRTLFIRGVGLRFEQLELSQYG